MNKVYSFVLMKACDSIGSKFFSISLIILLPLFSVAQSNGDFRTATSGIWSSSTTWERYSVRDAAWEASGVGENNPGNIPDAANNVYIQSGHTVTLDRNESCNDLNISTGTTSATAGAEGSIALGPYTLSVNGRLRDYYGPVGAPTAGNATSYNVYPFTATSGKLSIVGNTRNITISGEWGATITNPQTGVFPIEVNLNNGQIVTMGTGIKASSWNVVAGTLDASTFSISIDNNVSGQGDVMINAGATIQSNASANNVFQSTSSAPAGTLTVNGTLRLLGPDPKIAMSSIAFNGIVEYSRSGSSPNQNFAIAANSGTNPNTYNNLVLGGNGVKTIPASLPVSIFGTLSITSTASLATNNNLILKSTSTNTARVAPISSSAATPISGNVTAERYISSQNNRAYRLLAPMVNTPTTIRDNWQEGVNNPDPSTNLNPNPGYGTHITGSTTGANGFDATVTGQPSLYTYDQVSSTQAWLPINNTDANNLNAKTGYLIFIRGDRSASNIQSTGSTNTTLRATGTLLIGDQTFTNLEGNGRFSLITNPYASPINWSTVYNDGTTTNNVNFENYYTYWDPNAGSRGTYVTVNSSGVNSLGTAATVEIQQGQAFFVKAKSGVSAPSFTIKETHKSTTSNIDVFRVGAPETFRTKLYFNDGARKLADGAVVVFSNDYSATVDGNDAEEIANFDENIAIARDGKMLSIEGRPLIETNDNIPLSIARLKQQQYEWQFEPSNFSAPNLQAYLQDKFLNTQTPISLTSATVIPFTVTSDAASSAADRFTVVFSQATTLPVTLGTVKAYQKGSGVQVEWNTLTESNIEKYEVEKSINGQQFTAVGSVASTGNSTSLKAYNWLDVTPNNGNNYYRIRSISKTGNATYSEVVKVNLSKGAERVSVYPNPVQGDVIGLQLNNIEKGTYTISITNKLGQQVYSKIIEHPGGSASQTLQTPAMAQGIYQLQLKSERKNFSVQVIKK